MTIKRRPVDFEMLVAKMGKGAITAESAPAIIAGTCPATSLLAWLGELNKDELVVAIWEYTDHVTIGSEMQPEDVQWLERARLFGPGGDLELRREGGEFYWRYVGDTKGTPECSQMPWPGTAINPVYVREQTALLWGERKAGQPRWFDDRTAGAELTYPVDGAPQRVQIRYREYTQAGHVLAVWFTGLEGYHG